MKTIRFCKSTVSMILALIMLVSMCTVAFLNTAAAETDLAETSATTTKTVYVGVVEYITDFVPTLHYWNSSISLTGDADLVDTGETKQYSVGNDYWENAAQNFKIYKTEVPVEANGMKTYNKSANSAWANETVNPSDTQIILVWEWNNGKEYHNKLDSYTPVEDVDPSQKVEISFLLNSDTKWVASDDAKMFIKAGSDVIEMDETVDTKSGHVMWTAEVAAASSYTFYRTSYFFDESNASSKAWNTWTASGRGTTNTVFKATSDTAGSWQAASTVNAADPEDITNFWDDLWIDTKGEGKPEHAVKVYYTGSTFHLYVPSYVDLSNVTVYSDHEKVVIGGTEYASGTKANLTTGTHTFAFKDDSTTTNKGDITIYQTTGTAAMLLTTKEELFTGTTAGLASDNAWPNDSGITSTNYNAVYKDAIETKGSIYLFKPNGDLVNNKTGGTTLKKIKGRGNSSFEASMKIYGKYAYNFNLDKKDDLIEGSTESKKWCLLANNVDHSMMRNTFAYQLADDLGLSYGPETLLVDAYDNGKYLGAYVITEKVEYGKNTLMAKDSLGNEIDNLDDANVDANSVFTADGEDYLYEFDTDDLDDGIETSMTVGGQTYKYKYYATYDRPKVTDDDGNELVAAADNLKFETPEDYNTTYNYLLEHELSSRFKAEASWFVTPKGQPVVVKYPEFATEDEMKWIINEYAAMEQAVYASGEEDLNEIGELIDVDSFAKMYLIHELAINLDSCATSYYIHNEYINGKSVLFAGPTWDFDWAMGAYAGDKKWIYNGSSVELSENMSNPEQMFAKNKAIKTDASASNDVTWEANYNLQAKLAHNDAFWTECQRIWTNDMAPLLYSYLIDDYSKETDTGIIVNEWLPKFQSSMDMNNARWGVYTKNDDWGTKVTSDYSQGTGLTATSNFKVGNTDSSGSASKNYANTVYYLNDWLVVRKNYMSGTGDLYNEDLLETYKVENVDFVAVLDDTTGVLTVTPSADVTMNNETVDKANYFYTIYVDGKAKTDAIPFTTASSTVTLEAGKESKVYVVVTVKDSDVNATSGTKNFSYNVEVPTVEVTLKFKSSSSYRYVPKVQVGKNDAVDMTKDGNKIAANASQTQQYFWYTATVEIPVDGSTTILFTNQYSMRASISFSAPVEGETYYFGCDNMNSGKTAVDLTNAGEYVRNFVKSATNMLTNDPEAAGVATTSLGGVIYKMGDADEDNEVSALDATTIQLALVGKKELSNTASKLSDFDLDSTRSIMDATNVQVYLASGN